MALELQRPKLMHKLPLAAATYKHTKFHAITLNGYGEMPLKPYTVCVTTFTMPAHLHGHTSWPFYSSLDDATTLKQVPFCSFTQGF